MLIRAVEQHHPDACIIDVRMRPTYTDEGVVAAEEIRSRWPQVGVLLLSTYVDPSWAQRLLRDGSVGTSATCSRTASTT